MTPEITSVSLSRLDLLTPKVRRTLFWELDDEEIVDAHAFDPEWEKEAWLSAVMLQWGPCVAAIHTAEHVLGNAVYAPPVHVPRSRTLPTSPMSADAVALCSIDIQPGHEDCGYDRALIDYVVDALANRGVRAVEAFGYRCVTPSMPKAFSRRIETNSHLLSPSEALIPEETLLDAGFYVLRDHDSTPLLRKDLGADLDWNAEVAAALRKLSEPQNISLLTVIDHPAVPAAPVHNTHLDEG